MVSKKNELCKTFLLDQLIARRHPSGFGHRLFVVQSVLTKCNLPQRLFWVLVVVTGFSWAAVMIRGSIRSWQETPIATIIQTKPIAGAPFPTVTVCPPK